MTEDNHDWCIGLQHQAQTWWNKIAHHMKMAETAKTWDTETYARIHATVDQQYAALAYAKAHEILWADSSARQMPDQQAETVRTTEILMGIGGQPNQKERATLALKLARQRGAP